MGMSIAKSLFLLAFFAIAGSGAAYADHAKLEKIHGSSAISIKRDGKNVSLKAGDLLQAGDELATDDHTSADVRFDDQTLVRVGVNSTYKIVEEQGASKFIHKLFSGIVRVLVPVKKEGNGDEIKFKMNTPEGTIGVRGTEFTVLREGSRTVLRGMSGKVMFGPAESDFAKPELFIYVPRGMESSVAAKGKPSEPKKYDMEGYLKELDKKGGVFGSAEKVSNVSMKRREMKEAAIAATVRAAPAANAEKPAPAANAEKPKAEAGLTPDEQLMAAVKGLNLAKAKKAAALGASGKQRDENGDTLLHMVVSKKNSENFITLLVDRGADVNARNKENLTPLMQMAMIGGPIENAKALLAFDADPNLKTKDNETALDLAKLEAPEKRYKKLIELLEPITNKQ